MSGKSSNVKYTVLHEYIVCSRVRVDHAKTAALVTLDHSGAKGGPSLLMHLLLLPASKKCVQGDEGVPFTPLPWDGELW